MSCDKPSAIARTSNGDETRWYDWIIFFVGLGAYGAMMGLMVYFVNGGFER